MAKDYVCVVDRGTTNVKAVLFDMDGRESFTASVPGQIPVVLKPGWFEQDMHEIWNTAVKAVRQVTAWLSDGDRITGVSVTGQGSGVYITDKDGNPVRQGITSLDTRADEIIQELGEEGILDWWYSQAHRKLGKESPLAHLLWLKKYEPEKYEKSSHILFSKDWLKYCLTGEYSTDLTDAYPNAMIGQDEKTYFYEGLDRLGIGEKKDALPPLIPAHEIAGYVTAKAAAETGLPEGIPVLSGAHDMMASCMGTGRAGCDYLLCTIGSWGGNYMVTPERRENISSSPHIVEGTYLTVYMDGNSGAVFDRMLRMHYSRPGEALNMRDAYRMAEAQARNAKYKDLIFLPSLFEALDEGNAGGGLYGLKNWHTGDDIMLAIYEGIVMHHYERVETKLVDAPKAETLYLGGGGAGSSLFAQLFADMFNRPVQIPDCDELAARGAALAALAGLGVKKDIRDALIPVSVKKTYCPDPENHKAMMEKLEIYKSLLKR